MLYLRYKVRNFFSYILLLSLLSPSVVEAFHAIYDSHDFSIEENLSIHESEFDCELSLFLIQEDDLDYLVSYSYESFISHSFKITFKQYKEILLNTDYSILPNRGPPILA